MMSIDEITAGDDEYRRVWWQSATLLATKLIYTPKKLSKYGKSNTKKRQLPQLTKVEKRKFALVALVGWLAPKSN